MAKEKVKRKVFIINDGGHDYSGAEGFGELIICSQGVVKKDDVHLMYRLLSDALIDAGPDDLLMVSGLASMGMVASAIMADQFGRVNLLLYSNNEYVEKTLVFSEV